MFKRDLNFSGFVPCEQWASGCGNGLESLSTSQGQVGIQGTEIILIVFHHHFKIKSISDDTATGHVR